MENSSRFFKNADCEYYPCHEGLDEINCLFCYCPFYFVRKCPGAPEFIERDGRVIKKCTQCVFPHRRENYDSVVAELKVVMRRPPDVTPRDE